MHFHLESTPFKNSWLLIFDNVEETLKNLPKRGGSILMTTQKKVVDTSFLLEIKPFTKEEALKLLEKITKERRSPAMEQLAADLEGIPPLMNYAAHFIKATPGCTAAEYQTLFGSQLLEKEGPLWKEMDVNRRYLKTLASSWQLPLQSLKKKITPL